MYEKSQSEEGRESQSNIAANTGTGEIFQRPSFKARYQKFCIFFHKSK